MIYDICELKDKRGSKPDSKLAHILYNSGTKEFQIINEIDESIPLTEELKKKFSLQEVKYKTLKTDFDFCGKAGYIYYDIKDGYDFQGVKKDISLRLILNFPYVKPDSDFFCTLDFDYVIEDLSNINNICSFQIPSIFFPCIDIFSKEVDDKMSSYFIDLCYWALLSTNGELGVDIESVHKNAELLLVEKRFEHSFFHRIDLEDQQLI